MNSLVSSSTSTGLDFCCADRSGHTPFLALSHPGKLCSGEKGQGRCGVAPEADAAAQQPLSLLLMLHRILLSLLLLGSGLDIAGSKEGCRHYELTRKRHPYFG